MVATEGWVENRLHQKVREVVLGESHLISVLTSGWHAPLEDRFWFPVKRGNGQCTTEKKNIPMKHKRSPWLWCSWCQPFLYTLFLRLFVVIGNICTPCLVLILITTCKHSLLPAPYSSRRAFHCHFCIHISTENNIHSSWRFNTRKPVWTVCLGWDLRHSQILGLLHKHL